MTFRKYLVLAGVTIFSAVGDSLLSYGMQGLGAVTPRQIPALILSVGNPWIVLGIIFLLGFFASYMTALSFADLTFVLPATSLSYVVLALIARFVLHEQISVTRWIGILLVSAGVAFVVGGPEITHPVAGPLAKTAEVKAEP